MKLNIKTLAACLLASSALVSCNNEFEDGASGVSYPEQIELGKWAPSYTVDGSNKYTLNLTVNEQGDTICDVTVYNPVTEQANVLGGGKVSYNKQTGMITANYDDSFYGGKARVQMAIKNDMKSAVAYIYTVTTNNNGQETLKRQDYVNMVESDTISMLGMWALANGQDLTLYMSGKADVSQNGEVIATGTFAKNALGTAVTTTDNKVYQLSTNEKGQTYATVDGQTYYAVHEKTAYVDDWEEVSTGAYYTSAFDFEVPDYVVLEYSPCRAEYRINMYNVFGQMQLPAPRTDNYLSFNWNKKTNKVSLTSSTKFCTGFELIQDGQNYGVVNGIPSGSTCKYEDGKFTFGITYAIDGVGPLLNGEDTFTPAEQ